MHISTIRISSFEDWQFYVLFILLTILTYIFSVFKQKIKVFIRAVFNIHLAEQSFRNNELSSTIFNFCLNLIFVGTFSYVLFLTHKRVHFFSDYSDAFVFFLSLLFVVTIYLSKNIFLAFISNIFPFGVDISFYRFNLNILNQACGVVLLPMIFLFTYGQYGTKNIVYFSLLVIWLAMLLFRYFKLLIIAAKHFKFYKFYFFLYFCTTEILPNVILVKLIIK